MSPRRPVTNQTAVSLPWPAAPVARALIDWQARHGRHDLPWQATRDPYRVWLSEVMLQQTQVSTVRAYYARFLARFPDVQALAAADEDEVLAAWSGLGYYRRARMAHACAREVVARHGGHFPGDSQTLATLPGIGRSTAAAVAAFCFGERVAILDGNVKRVLSRAIGFDGDLRQAAQHNALWTLAEALVPEHGVEAYTQGLMDLGAGVCLPREPLCERCPIEPWCVARREGQPLRYPVQSAPRARGARASVWLWVEQGTRWWWTKRPVEGVWGGLWSPVEFESFEALQAATVGWPGEGRALPTVTHALTHFEWTLHPRVWRLPDDADAARWTQGLGGAPSQWLARDEALALGLPTPWRRLLASGAMTPRP